MRAFGETIRDLRVAQDLGLRETATKVGISPAYLSRIERGKESPPRPEVTKELARVLAADPDVLFRLSAATDPELATYMNEKPYVLNLVRRVMDQGLTESQVRLLIEYADEVTKEGG